MLKLKKLSFKNIRRFVDKQVIDFSDRQKLLQIDGKNNNTGGSSGAGKSTVFLALDYLLGISDVPSTVLQSRLTKDPIEVEGVFETNGKPLLISRSKKNGLSVSYNGETVSGNVKLADERLQEIIGIPRSVFKKMVHKKQKEGGFFIDMTGKQTYEFLSEVLDLAKYQLAIAAIIENNSTSKKELDNAQITIQLEQSNVKDLERVLSEKDKPVSTVTDEELHKCKTALDDKKIEQQGLEDKMKEDLAKLEKPKETELEYDKTELNRLNLLLSKKDEACKEAAEAKGDVSRRLSEMPLLRERAMSAGQKIFEISEKQKEIKKSICPTCNQSWVGETAKEKLTSLEKTKKSYIEKALDTKRLIESEPALKTKLERVEQIIVKTEAEIASIRQDILSEQQKMRDKELEVHKKNTALFAEYKVKEQAIKDEYQQRLTQLKDTINEIQIDYSSKKNEVNSYNAQLASYESEVSKLGQLISDKKKKIEQAKALQKSLASEVLVADETKRLIKSYTLQTFQDTLNSIGHVATEILSNIPNMSNATIYFEGCKENKDGSIKDEVTGILNLDGETVPIKSLSGGERTSVDLAVDLAVIDIIETKAGKGADFYIIDEPFDGLDAVCRENCLEILKQVDTNKTIIMVDHSSELKEMVGDVVTVVRSGETSHVQ